jgi:hypothetical protein
MEHKKKLAQRLCGIEQDEDKDAPESLR